jgi:hypothetical protein
MAPIIPRIKPVTTRIGGLILAIAVGGAIHAQDRKKKDDKEPTTQTLPLLKDPPAAAVAKRLA